MRGARKRPNQSVAKKQRRSHTSAGIVRELNEFPRGGREEPGIGVVSRWEEEGRWCGYWADLGGVSAGYL